MKEYHLYDINSSKHLIKAEKVEIWDGDTVVFLVDKQLVAMAFLHNIIAVIEFKSTNDQ